VHADHLTGTPGHSGDTRQRNRRGVTGENCVGLAQLIELLEDIQFERFVLGRGLNDDIDIGQVGQCGSGADVGQGSLLVRFSS